MKDMMQNILTMMFFISDFDFFFFIIVILSQSLKVMKVPLGRSCSQRQRLLVGGGVGDGCAAWRSETAGGRT